MIDWKREVILKRAITAMTVSTFMVTGCSAAPAAVVGGNRPSAAAPVAPSGEPIPASGVKDLPPGVFYILGGTTAPESNVWEVTRHGLEKQLTHNPSGFGIDAFAASQAGIILADALHGGDQLARLTGRGPVWLRPAGAPHSFINGQLPDIRPNGQIAYVLPPANPTKKKQTFTLWVKKSFEGPAHLLARQGQLPSVPLFGPAGQIATVGPIGSPGHVRIISRSGKVRTLNPGFSVMGYPPLWGQRAPALVIPPARGAAKLYFTDGSWRSIPAGWHPLSWNTAGTLLLMRSGSTLGTWSPANPGSVTSICTINKSFQITQVGWLNKPARL